MIKTEADIEKLVENDAWMMDVLRTAEHLHLPDWWIGAGFLRNRVWDAVQGNKPVKSHDVDLVYFDSNNIMPETDWDYDDKMNKEFPIAKWEIRNQARMHYKNGFLPFNSTADGISHWVETATCVAVKLDNGQLKFLFCYGSDDLLHLIARPIQYSSEPPLLNEFYKRIDEKKWRERWPELKVAP